MDWHANQTFSCIFQCKNASFILKAHVLLDISAGDPNAGILVYHIPGVHRGGFPTGPVGTGYFSFIAVTIRRLV